MEKEVCRLLTAMISFAAVLGLRAFLFQGVAFMAGICFYGAVIYALIGAAKGFLTMIDCRREMGKE